MQTEMEIARVKVRSQWAYARINENKKVYAMHETAKIYPKRGKVCEIYVETTYKFNGKLTAVWDGSDWKMSDISWQEAVRSGHARVLMWCYKEGQDD